jgi:hypothetical protein
MDDESIAASPAPKKPYTRPQLHELTGSSADGKPYTHPFETNDFAPS